MSYIFSFPSTHSIRQETIKIRFRMCFNLLHVVYASTSFCQGNGTRVENWKLNLDTWHYYSLHFYVIYTITTDWQTNGRLAWGGSQVMNPKPCVFFPPRTIKFVLDFLCSAVNTFVMGVKLTRLECQNRMLSWVVGHWAILLIQLD